MIKRYRKKPVVVEAFQMPYNTAEDWVIEEAVVFAEAVVPNIKQDYAAGQPGWNTVHASFGLVIPTLEGDHRVSPGDYIIKGVAGEYYPCKPDIFHATYEEVE